VLRRRLPLPQTLTSRVAQDLGNIGCGAGVVHRWRKPAYTLRERVDCWSPVGGRHCLSFASFLLDDSGCVGAISCCRTSYLESELASCPVISAQAGSDGGGPIRRAALRTPCRDKLSRIWRAKGDCVTRRLPFKDLVQPMLVDGLRRRYHLRRCPAAGRPLVSEIADSKSEPPWRLRSVAPSANGSLKLAAPRSRVTLIQYPMQFPPLSLAAVSRRPRFRTSVMQELPYPCLEWDLGTAADRSEDRREAVHIANETLSRVITSPHGSLESPSVLAAGRRTERGQYGHSHGIGTMGRYASGAAPIPFHSRACFGRVHRRASSGRYSACNCPHRWTTHTDGPLQWETPPQFSARFARRSGSSHRYPLEEHMEHRWGMPSIWAGVRLRSLVVACHAENICRFRSRTGSQGRNGHWISHRPCTRRRVPGYPGQIHAGCQRGGVPGATAVAKRSVPPDRPCGHESTATMRLGAGGLRYPCHPKQVYVE